MNDHPMTLGGGNRCGDRDTGPHVDPNGGPCRVASSLVPGLPKHGPEVDPNGCALKGKDHGPGIEPNGRYRSSTPIPYSRSILIGRSDPWVDPNGLDPGADPTGQSCSPNECYKMSTPTHYVIGTRAMSVLLAAATLFLFGFGERDASPDNPNGGAALGSRDPWYGPEVDPTGGQRLPKNGPIIEPNGLASILPSQNRLAVGARNRGTALGPQDPWIGPQVDLYGDQIPKTSVHVDPNGGGNSPPKVQESPKYGPEVDPNGQQDHSAQLDPTGLLLLRSGPWVDPNGQNGSLKVKEQGPLDNSNGGQRSRALAGMDHEAGSEQGIHVDPHGGQDLPKHGPQADPNGGQGSKHGPEIDPTNGAPKTDPLGDGALTLQGAGSTPNVGSQTHPNGRQKLPKNGPYIEPNGLLFGPQSEPNGGQIPENDSYVEPNGFLLTTPLERVSRSHGLPQHSPEIDPNGGENSTRKVQESPKYGPTVDPNGGPHVER